MKSRMLVGFIVVACLAIFAVAQDSSGPQYDAAAKIRSEPPVWTGEFKLEQQAPINPRDLMQAYRQGMEQVFEKTCHDLEQIAEAARQGTVSREQAEYASIQRYQLGLMTFELLQTLYESADQEISRAAPPRDSPGLLTAGDALLVSPPSSSTNVSPAITQNLALNPAQIAAIQAFIEEDRQRKLPLIEKLADNRRKMSAVMSNGSVDEKKIEILAAEQAQILKQIIISDAQFETKVYQTLTDEQRRKLDELRKSGTEGGLEDAAPSS